MSDPAEPKTAEPSGPSDSGDAAREPVADAAGGADRAGAAAEIEALEQEAPHAPDGRRRAALWLRAGQVRERVLGDTTGARTCYSNARKAAPDWPATRRACLRAAQAAEDWKEVARLLEEEVKTAADPVDAAAELADVFLHRLERFDDALIHVRSVLDRQPAHPRALDHLHRLLTQKEKWSELVDRLVRAAESAKDAARSASLFYEAGQILRNQRKDLKGAAECFEKALDADSAAIVALKALSEVAALTSDWTRLARVLEREASADSGDVLAAGALIHLAAVREDLLDDAAGSAEAYRRALESDADNLLAIQGLARFAETQSNPVELARIYERELALTSDPVQAAAIRYVLGELCEGSLQAPERAVNHYRKALEATPDHGPAFRALGQLYARLGEWLELAKLYQQEAEQTQDPAYRAHTWYKLAELYEERLDDEDNAIDFNRQVLDAVPDYLPALRALGRLLAKRADWGGLADLYDAEIAVTDDAHHRALLLAKLAELYDERLQNFAQAADCHRRILEIDDKNVTSVRALARLAWRRADWDELVAMNMREVELVIEPRVQAALFHKTGEVYEEHLDDPQKAKECYRESLQRMSSYLPALRSLGRLAQAQNDWGEVARTMEAEAQQMGETPRSQSLLLGAAEIYEKRLDDPRKAMDTYRRLLQRDAGFAPAVRAMSRLLRTGGHWKDLAKLLEATLGHADESYQSGIMQSLAEIVGHRLSNDKRATQLLAQARDANPDQGAPLRGLEEYLARQERWVELAEVYRRAAELAPAGGFRAALYTRLGDLAKDVADNVEFASSYYRSALQEAPGDRTALSRLKRVALDSNEADTLAQCLANEAQRGSDKDERRVLMLELASVHERMGRAAQAADCYAMAAGLGQDAGLWGLAAESFRAADRPNEALDAYNNAAELAGDDGEEHARYRMSAAEVLEMELSDAAGAAEILRDLAKEGPDPLTALLSLERIESSRENHEIVAEIRSQLAELSKDPKRALHYRLLAADTLNTLDRPDEAAAELEKVLAVDPSRIDAARLLGQIREKLGDIDASIQAFEAASRAAPNDREPLNALERLYTTKEAWEPLLTVYNRLITSAPDPEAAAEAFHQKGVILADKLGMVDKAQVHFERALEAHGSYAPSLDRMVKIHVAAERWQAARDALEKLLSVPGYRTSERICILGQLLERGFKDDLAAISAYREAVQVDSKNKDALEALAAILERTEDWSGLVAVYQELIQTAERERLLYLQKKLAELYEKHLNRPDDAAQAWLQVIREEPDNIEAHQALARIYALRSETVDKALEEHREVLKIDPLRASSYQSLVEHYEKSKMHDRRMAVLDVLVLLRATSNEQMMFYNDRFRELPRPGASKQQLTADDVRYLLIHPEMRQWPIDFLAEVGDSIMKSRNVDLQAKYGVSKNDRVGVGTKNPLQQRVDAIRVLFDIPPFHLYVLPKTETGWYIEVTADGLSLLLGSGIGRLSLAAQDFIIAKALFYIVTGWYPLAHTGAEELAREIQLATAAMGVTQPPAGDREVGRRVKLITKSIPRRKRKEVAELMTKYLQAPKNVDMAALLSMSSVSADRAGLVAARSIQRALEVLALTQPELSSLRVDDTDSIEQSLPNSPVGRELMRFAVSDDYFTLRKRLGLGIYVV